MRPRDCSRRCAHHDPGAFLAEAERECRQRGLRLTPLRRLVLELIAKSPHPIKAYELLESLKQRHGRAAPPTVYRALEFWLGQGFVHRIASQNSYVGCPHPTEPHPRAFLVCEGCQGVIELAEDRLSRLLTREASRHGFHARAQVIEVQGLCEACAAERRG
jgi:Fur family zinc uptake transcriptional regulator